MIIRSAGLALLLATFTTQAETASISRNINIEPSDGAGSLFGNIVRSTGAERSAVDTAVAERRDAIDGGLSQISEALTRALEERLARDTEAEAFDLQPVPVLNDSPKVASIPLP